MKKLILIASTAIFAGLTALSQDDGFGGSASQDLKYYVRATYKRPVKKAALSEAKLISDFLPGYPVNWITRYTSVEILTTCNGKTLKGVSKSDVMSEEQKNILNTVEAATDIIINVRYQYKNPVTENFEDKKINISFAIVPEVEAEYVGGYRELIKYLKENRKISEAIPKQFRAAAVKFTINEKGEIANAKISRTSGDPKRDELLLEAINNMPGWKPAENSKGIKIKQEFEFSIDGGRSGNGC